MYSDIFIRKCLLHGKFYDSLCNVLRSLLVFRQSSIKYVSKSADMQSTVQQLCLKHPVVRAKLGLPDKAAPTAAAISGETVAAPITPIISPTKKQKISVQNLSPKELLAVSGYEHKPWYIILTLTSKMLQLFSMFMAAIVDSSQSNFYQKGKKKEQFLCYGNLPFSLVFFFFPFNIYVLMQGDSFVLLLLNFMSNF